jgi:hypothetical protein
MSLFAAGAAMASQAGASSVAGAAAAGTTPNFVFYHTSVL